MYMDNLPEFGLDDLPNRIPNDITTTLGNIPHFPNVPAILVDKDDSVCYPCTIVQDMMPTTYLN